MGQSFSSEMNDFIKSHKALCIGTLGIAIVVKSVGVMGGRVIKAITQSTGSSKKTSKKANEVLNKKGQSAGDQTVKKGPGIQKAKPLSPPNPPTTSDVPPDTEASADIVSPPPTIFKTPEPGNIDSTAQKVSTASTLPQMQSPPKPTQAAFAQALSRLLMMNLDDIPFNRDDLAPLDNGLFMAKSIKNDQTIVFLQDRLAWDGNPQGTSFSINTATGEVRFKDQGDTVQNPGEISEIAALMAKFTPTSASSASPYGNKFKGLEDVNRILTDKPLENVFVPLPKGLSHDQVQQILMKEAPQVFAKWNQLGSEFKDSPNRAQFLDQPQTKQTLAEIRGAIEQVFLKTTFDSPELIDWLASMQGKDLMVRSSSIEDSGQVVNAGGNLSEAYVPPDRQQVLASCGRVIASYFGEASLKNQIQANINPFNAKLQLSVIMQELIGESLSDKKEIPVSLVFFTTEPNYSEGGFPVSTFSVTHGHGEGVVNNEKVKTDTVYAVRSRSREPAVEMYQKSAKPQRLAPVRSGKDVKLQLVDNPPELRDKRCLSKEMVQRLMVLGEEVESKMGRPMDMEIVIKGDKIYIVQMREIKREKPNPTYLSEEAIEATGKSPVVDSVYSKVLGAGKSSALKISNKNEVLHCKTLKQAEDEFVAGKHKMVIVDNDEPALSHPVINFSSMGIPCFYASDETSSLIRKVSTHTPLVACSQSGRVCVWDQKQASLDDCIKPGFYSHPAYMEFKAHHRSPINESGRIEVPNSMIMAFRALKAAKTETAALGILKGLKEQTLVADLKGKISTVSAAANSPHALEQIKTLQKIEKHIDRAFAEIEKSFTQDVPRMGKLYHIKKLSTLLHGNQTAGSYSLLDVDAHIQSINRAIAYQGKLKTPAQFVKLLDFDSLIINPNDKPKWEEFLFKIEQQDAGTAESFNHLMQILHESSAFPMWINTVFLPKFKENSDPKVLLGALLPKAGQEAQSFIHLTQMMKELEGLNPASFNDPQRFQSQWKALQPIMQQYASPEVLNQLSGSELNRNLALGVMRKYIDLIDETIKTIKASPQYSEKEKLLHKNTILQENYNVMKAWTIAADKLNPIPIRKGEHGAPGDLNSYFKFMEDAWSTIDLTDLKNLNSSTGFSVLAAAVGSQTLFTRHEPKTLEDIFTLIHQNQLFTLSHINQSLANPKITEQLGLPKFIEEFPVIFKTNALKSAQKIGLEIGSNNVTMKYNIPLNNHSLCIDIEYNQSSEMVMHVKFFGQRGGQRWRDISAFAECMDEIGLIKTKKISPYTNQELQFSWEVNEKQTDLLITTLSEMMDIADGGRGVSIVSFLKGLNENGEKFAAALMKRNVTGEMSYLEDILLEYRGTQLVTDALEHIQNSYGKSSDKEVIEEETSHLASLHKLRAYDYNDKKLLELVKRYFDKDLSFESLTQLFNCLIFEDVTYKGLLFNIGLPKVDALEKNHISEEAANSASKMLFDINVYNLSNDEKKIYHDKAEAFLKKLPPEMLKNDSVSRLVMQLESERRYLNLQGSA